MSIFLLSNTVYATTFMSSELIETEKFSTTMLEPFFESIDMSINPDPILNQLFEITVTASSPSVNVSNVTLELLLPEGFELISGNLRWTGDLHKDEIKNLNAEIKAVNTGDMAIQFLATADLPSGFTFLDTKFLYFSVTETESEVSNIRIVNQATVQAQIPENQIIDSLRVNTIDITEELEGSVESIHSVQNVEAAATGGTINVFGHFYFSSNTNIGNCIEDSATNSYFCPVRHAKVQLFDQDLGEVWIEDSYTDDNGRFYFGNINNDDGWFEDGLDVFAKVHATHWDPSPDGVYVTDGNIFDISYWGRAPNEGNLANQPNGDVDMGSWVITESGAWTIYEWDLQAYEYLKNTVSWNQPKVEVIWPATEGPVFHGGPLHYDIHIPTGSELDQDVNQHEYSHAIMWKLYGNAFPPTSFSGNHFLEQETDGGFALIEGWAQFLPGAIQNSDSYRWANMETDHFEEDSSSGFGDFDGDIVEGAVAATLWDIRDDTSSDDGLPGSDDDGISNEFTRLWNVMRDHRPDNINVIWDGWFDADHNYGYKPEMNAIFWDHHIDKNTPPSCTITSPNDGGCYSGTISVSANTFDSDGEVSQVKFQYSLDNNVWNDIGTDVSSSGGWSFKWNTEPISDPSVWVRCQAYDTMEWGEFDTSGSSFGIDNTPPDIPTSLIQYESDGVAVIPLGGITTEGTVIMKGSVSDPVGNNVQLEIEVRSIGTAFTDTPTCTSGPAVASGGTASATCTGLADGQYH
jgi:hypothetical protein